MTLRERLVWVGLLTASAPAALAQQRLAVPLSDPGRPATLDVSLFMGEITVTAYDGDEVVVVIDDDDRNNGRNNGRNDDRGDDEARQREGLRRIPNTTLGLTLGENENTVSVKLDFSPRKAELNISVPRRTSVHASVVNGGDVVVTGVTGEHELSNVNGDVVATDISGAAVVGTTNGDVKVSFADVTPGKAMSFSSFNGDLDVTLPANLGADLRVNSGHGDLFTDFEVELTPQPAVVERGADAGGRYRVRMERGMRAVIGGGGPEITFRTFNGDVIIRKR
jgi:hypothetical protein